MNFGFDEEQNMLRESVRRFLDKSCPLTKVRQLKETDEGYSEEHWQEIAKAGWLGILIPEQYGGTGLQWIDLIVILEEMGRSVFPSPFIGNTLAAAAIVDNGSDAQKQQWLPGLADGSIKATVALFEDSDTLAVSATALHGIADGDGYSLRGEKRLITDPKSADMFVVSFRYGDQPQDLALAIIDAKTEGLTAEAFPLIDQTKRMGNLTLDNVKLTPEQIIKPDDAITTLERMIDQGAITITGEMSGSVDAALRLTVDYANERKQFGHAIGHFQSVKHPLAALYADMESFRSLLYYAAWCVDNRPSELSRFSSLAKAYATDTCIKMGTDSILFHGAAGYAVEFDIHLFYLRSKWARPMFGDSAAHYERSMLLRLDENFTVSEGV